MPPFYVDVYIGFRYDAFKYLRLTCSCLSLQGICQAASYIYKKLVNDGILNQAFSIAPVRGIAEISSLSCSRDALCVMFQYRPGCQHPGFIIGAGLQC